MALVMRQEGICVLGAETLHGLSAVLLVEKMHVCPPWAS